MKMYRLCGNATIDYTGSFATWPIRSISLHFANSELSSKRTGGIEPPRKPLCVAHHFSSVPDRPEHFHSHPVLNKSLPLESNQRTPSQAAHHFLSIRFPSVSTTTQSPPLRPDHQPTCHAQRNPFQSGSVLCWAILSGQIQTHHGNRTRAGPSCVAHHFLSSLARLRFILLRSTLSAHPPSSPLQKPAGRIERPYAVTGCPSLPVRSTSTTPIRSGPNPSLPVPIS